MHTKRLALVSLLLLTILAISVYLKSTVLPKYLTLQNKNTNDNILLYSEAKNLQKNSLYRLNFKETQATPDTYTFYLSRSLPTNEHLTNYLSNISLINLNDWQKESTTQPTTTPNEFTTVFKKTQENINFLLTQIYKISYSDPIKNQCPCTIFLKYELKVPSNTSVKK